MNKTFEYITSVTISACVVALFVAITLDFYLYQSKNTTKHEKHSVVATGSMIGFYVIYCILLKFRIGKLLDLPNDFLKIQVSIGVVMVVVGTVVNIIGRLQLKGNWANHIKIYKNHRLVTKGVYSFVRHPLYSSIILMLYGGSLIYSNWLSAMLVTVVFVPSMAYRAKQEEQLLFNEFPEYVDYKGQIGMFFPKQLRRYKSE